MQIYSSGDGLEHHFQTIFEFQVPKLWARPNYDERTLLSAGARSLRKDVAKVREHHSSCLKWLPLALLGVSQDERQHWPQASHVPATWKLLQSVTAGQYTLINHQNTPTSQGRKDGCTRAMRLQNLYTAQASKRGFYTPRYTPCLTHERPRRNFTRRRDAKP